MERPLLLGHRGCRPPRHLLSSPVPQENTIAAFDLCLEAGCDGFELDVRATSDRKLVICHDPKWRRRTVAAETFSHLCGDPVQLCCLDQVLDRYKKTAFLDIELKIAGIEEQVAALIHRVTPQRGFVVSSFLPEVITAMHAIAPSLPLGFIFDKSASAAICRQLPVKYVMPHYKLLTEQAVREFHAAGKAVMAWTVNESRNMKRFSDWGVEALIGDDPRALCGAFCGRGRQGG